ncbi:hypothetical protein [Erythrobacter donghaensis]|uniref:hypothetical protein n=1 Tax=Erythrobacter donghaensis TaxID=267135 RepID=UPI00093C7BD2|nr:hypothetical protein [Erythrobacter donghaensis]
MRNTLFNRTTGAIAAALITLGIAQPAAAQTNEQFADSQLRELVRVDGWACSYVNWSARNVQIIASDAVRVVVAARYDYRCGDDTLSDTVYMSFSNGIRTCSAYRSFGKACSLDGRKYDI